MRRLGMTAWLLVVGLIDADAAKLSFEIENEEGRLLPCRIHLFDQDEKPQRAAGLPFGVITLCARGRPSLSCRLAATATRSSAARSTNG